MIRKLESTGAMFVLLALLAATVIADDNDEKQKKIQVRVRKAETVADKDQPQQIQVQVQQAKSDGDKDKPQQIQVHVRQADVSGEKGEPKRIQIQLQQAKSGGDKELPKQIQLRIRKADSAGGDEESGQIEVQAVVVSDGDAPKDGEKKVHVRAFAVGKGVAISEAKAGAHAKSDKEGRQIEVQTVVVSDGDAPKDGEKKVHVRAFAVREDGQVDVEKMLKDSGLKGDQLKKVQEALKKVLNNMPIQCAPGEPCEGTMQVRVFPQGTIVGKDGEPQKVELKVLATAVRDGVEAKKSITSHVIQVDADGKAQEAIKKALENLKKHGLDEKQQKKIREKLEQALKSQHGQMVIRMDADLGNRKFMIGVECAEMDDTLREKAGVKEGVGVVVKSVFDDTPAAKAGLKERDILIKIGDADLKNAGELIKAIQSAGEKNEKMTVTLRRGDDEKTVVIEPAKTGDVDLRQLPMLRSWSLGSGAAGNWEFPQGRILMFGPGVVTDTPPAGQADSADQTEEVKRLRKQVEQLTKQVKQLQAAVKKMKSDDGDDDGDDND